MATIGTWKCDGMRSDGSLIYDTMNTPILLGYKGIEPWYPKYAPHIIMGTNKSIFDTMKQPKPKFKVGTIVYSAGTAVLVTGKGKKGLGYTSFAGVCVMSKPISDNLKTTYNVGRYSDTWAWAAFKETNGINFIELIRDKMNEPRPIDNIVTVNANEIPPNCTSIDKIKDLWDGMGGKVDFDAINAETARKTADSVPLETLVKSVLYEIHNAYEEGHREIWYPVKYIPTNRWTEICNVIKEREFTIGDIRKKAIQISW